MSHKYLSAVSVEGVGLLLFLEARRPGLEANAPRIPAAWWEQAGGGWQDWGVPKKKLFKMPWGPQL